MTDVREADTREAGEPDAIAKARALADAHVMALQAPEIPDASPADVEAPARHRSAPAAAREFLRYSAGQGDHYAGRQGVRRRRAVAIGVVLVLGGGLIASRYAHAGATAQPAKVAVRATGSLSTVTLTAGSDDLADLQHALAASGHPGLLRNVAGGAVAVDTNLVVGPGATLTIKRSALLLRSDAAERVRVKVQGGGTLDLDDDTVTSWTAAGAIDTDTSGVRADITATGRGSVLDIDRSELVGLGSAKGYPGLTWRSGASGTVVDSTFTHGWRCGYAYRSGKLSVSGSSFMDCGADGLLLQAPGAGTSVDDSRFSDNAASGLEVTGRLTKLDLKKDTANGNHLDGLDIHPANGTVDLSDGMFSANAKAGVFVGSGTVDVTKVKSWSNQVGLSFDGGRSTVSSSELSANQMDGIRVNGPRTQVSADSDRLDNNSRSGLWLSDGNVSVQSTNSSENLNGMEVTGLEHYFHARADIINDNVKDGVSLDLTRGVVVKGNTIDGNGDSGLSALKKVDVTPILKQNQLRNNQTATRIRASD